MASPNFEVAVFLACRSVQTEGVQGPGSLLRQSYTLEGVSYVYHINALQGAPYSIEELWLYLRLVRTNLVAGTRELGLKVLSVLDDGRRVNTTPGRILKLGSVSLPKTAPVVSVVKAIRQLEVPRTGRFELRLYKRLAKSNWRGRQWARVASHFLAVEFQP
jgi:hypothetical protein